MPSGRIAGRVLGAGFGIVLAASLALPAPAQAGANVLEVIHAFDDGNDQDGKWPVSRLVELDGVLYGTASEGGDDDCGTIFSVTPGGAFERLHSMISGLHGCQLPAGLTPGPDDKLYGISQLFGPAPNIGTAYSITTAGEFEWLHSFGGVGNPAAPVGALVFGSDDIFYGTTSGGGAGPVGTVYSMTPVGEVTLLHSFNGLPGAAPRAALIEGDDGAFYGVTPVFGDCDVGSCGTVFRITAEGDYEVLHSFTGSGQSPSGPLVQGPDGKLYGMNSLGGNNNGGTIFRLDIDGGNFEIVHAFNVVTDGLSGPAGGLVVGDDGDLYGTASGVFRLTTAGVVTPLVRLADLVTAGLGISLNGVIMASDGQLYGTARNGGGGDCGSVIEIPVDCGVVYRVVLDDSGDNGGDGGGNNNAGGGGGGSVDPWTFMLLLIPAVVLWRRDSRRSVGEYRYLPGKKAADQVGLA